jgi:hypothetical protein
MANTSLIGLTLPVQGTLSGSWGNTVNNAISQIVDVAVAGTQTITVDTDINLAVTTGTDASTGLTANSSQYAVLLCTGARTALRFINTPKQSKTYVVINDTTGGFAVTVRGGPTSPTTGVTVAAGTRAIIAWNGSDFVNVGGGSAAGSNTQVQFNDNGELAGSAGLVWNGTTLTATNLSAASLTLTSTPLAIASGGTNSNATPTLGGVGYGTGTAHAYTASGLAGKVLTANGAAAPTWEDAPNLPKASGALLVNTTTVSESYVLPAGSNAFSVGPITIADSYTVTVSSGQRWVVI